MRCNHSLSVCLLLIIGCANCRADWFDNHWQFRRMIDVNWDADHASGRDLAMVEFYTAGHAAADGSDIRVAREDGRLVASHVLRGGLGDRVSVVFALAAGQTRYAVYFGNADVAPPPPPGMEDVQYHCGLLMEMRRANNPRVNGMGDFPAAWDQAGPVIGRTLVGQPFYGVDPFGDYQRVITRLSGWLVVPVDGEYYFAGSVTGRGAIFLDGKPVLFMANHVGDQRFNVTLHLDRGGHEFVLYHYQPGGEDIVSVVWKRPDMSKPEILARQSFGIFARGRPGPLEEQGHALVADFEAQYVAEYFLGGNYSHRYQLTAHAPSGAKCDWDFGDGLNASGATVEHVFVTAGVYPICLTVRWNGNSDTQTVSLPVDRDWENIDQAQLDPLMKQARIIAGYDVSRVREDWLPWMIPIEQQALMTAPATAAGDRLASVPRHANATVAMIALRQVSGDLEAQHKFDDALHLWDLVPGESDLNPMAACYEAGMLDWTVADFARALKVMEPYAKSSNPPAKLSYAMALVLANRAGEAAPIFDSLQAGQEKLGANLGAVSGAMARTIEFRIAQRDWENGEADWDSWQTRCPAVFMEGYSVLLRTKFVEQHVGFLAAAKIAEAFAGAVPASPYAPQLLDRASRLLIKADPGKSKALRDELKAKYPEDPLSQDESK